VTDVAVLTEDLRRTFGETAAVDAVNLAVSTGEVYGFLGPNGAGKSTLVRMLCTLLRPTSGRAAVGGFDVVRHPEDVRLRIGVALQEAALDDRQTGRELLHLQARLYGIKGGAADQRLEEVLEMVDIGTAIDRRVGTYSGGMKRRLDLAAALIHNPDVLFLDEPTTGLDPASRVTVWTEVRRLNRQLGMTIFLTTQYLEEADELADRVGIIDNGHLVAEGTPADLKRSVGDDVIVARLTDSDHCARAAAALAGVAGVDSVDQHSTDLTIRARDGSSVLSPVAVALANAGCTVRSLTLRTPSLDDVFLQLTGAHIEDDA
jgi:ABC-2 type transport system ATP-binding protein